MSSGRVLLLAALLAARPGPVAAEAPVVAPPRPISEAEREAVRLSADYLDRGPAAFQEALATISPLRALPAAEARDEIEVRAGGRADVRWELRTPDPGLGPELAVFSIEAPSGLDDTLLVRMVEERGAWRVLWLRSFHERWVEGRTLAVRGTAPSAFDLGTLLVAAGAVALLAAFLLLMGISFLPDKPVVAAAWGVTGAAVLALLVAALSGSLPIPGLARRSPELFARLRRNVDVDRLARLLPLRRRLEAGDPRGTAESLALVKPNPEPMAQLWIAQHLLATGALPDARRVLAGLKDGSQVPWAVVLRARIALLEKRDVDAAAAYASAAEQGVAHDGILVEALSVARSLGFARPDLALNQRLFGLGTRSAEARILLASGLLADEKIEPAESVLLSAFRERPPDREELLADDDLRELLHRPAILRALDLVATVPAVVASPDTGRRAIPLPAGAGPRVCGRALRVAIGTAELHVPGGAELAPAGTPAEDAGAERRALVERALADAPRLAADPPSQGAFVQPVLRRRIVRTAFVLARRNRWADLVSVTARLGGNDEQVPAELVMLRAQGLRRTGRVEEARTLLTELGASAALTRRNDAMTWYELGEMFVGIEDFDRGLRFLQKAASRMTRDLLFERIVQVKTEQKLAARFTSFTSRHFEIRFPPERRDGLGAEAARVLEAERTRLAKWLPARDELKTTVQLLWLDEFRRTYGASGDVLGIYDGKIRVPLAGVGRFVPFVVSLVTHELAHALIADLTRDNAPHWFHEGLAQHLEMRRFRPNYITQYEQQGTLLSLPVVEAVLERFPDPWFIEQAYQESEWTVAYIDAHWGTAGLTRLLGAFRDGLSGDEALRKALGVDTAQLSRDFVAWSLKQPKMLHDEIVAYDNTPDDTFHLSRDPKEPLEKAKPAEIPESLTDH